MKWNLFWRLRFDFFVEHFWYLTVAHYFSHLETIRLSIQPNYFWVNWKKIFSPIQSILMLITEKTLFTNLFTDKQTVKVFRMKMLTSKRARFELFMIEYCAMVKIEKTFWIVMFHIYYCINYISYYLYEEKSLLHDKLAEKGLTSSPDCPRVLSGYCTGCPRSGIPNLCCKNISLYYTLWGTVLKRKKLMNFIKQFLNRIRFLTSYNMTHTNYRYDQP